MRWVSLSSFVLLACGGSNITQQQLNDGSWQFTCQLPMDDCVRRAQEQCPNQRYRILEGTSATRLRGPPPFETAHHTSHLHLVCSRDGVDKLLSSSESDKPATKAAAATCSTGETRKCVGAGACQGGQACLPDGKGFGACDCGSAAATPAIPSGSLAPVPASSVPGGEVAPAPSTPPATSGQPSP